MTTESEGSFHVDDDSIDFWNVRLKSKTAELLPYFLPKESFITLAFPICRHVLQALWSIFSRYAGGLFSPVAMRSKSPLYCLSGKCPSFFWPSPVKLFSFGVLMGVALQLRVRSTNKG